jgi:hypothetical protein
MIAPDLEPLVVDIDSLVELPGNPRRGDVEAVMRSYRAFGQQKPVVVQHREDETVVVDGNHQLQAARLLGWKRLATTEFMVEDPPGSFRPGTVEEANAYALAANHTSDLGTYDERDLLSMAVSVDPVLLEAASYTDEDLDNLRRKFNVTVHFATDEACDSFFELIDRPRRKFMWWPSQDDSGNLELGACAEQFVNAEATDGV